jgi:nitroreductase
METWGAVRARRNVRSYSDKPLAAQDLERVLEAGWLAPSANNRQHRDFVVCTDREKLGQLAHVWQWARHVAGSAATVAVVLPALDDQTDREMDHFDAGQAVMAMMLVAADLGIGSGHSAVTDQVLARKVLGFPDDHFCAHLVALGYPADRPLTPIKKFNRRPMEEVVHQGSW